MFTSLESLLMVAILGHCDKYWRLLVYNLLMVAILGHCDKYSCLPVLMVAILGYYGN